MKTACTLILLLTLTGCNYLEAQSTLNQVHSLPFPTTEEIIINNAGCREVPRSTQIADRFLENPGASHTNWYILNRNYDLVIRTDSNTNYQVICRDDVWIEQRRNSTRH